MDVEVEAELSGFSDRDDTLRIRASGPVRTRRNEFPELDLDLDADAGDAQPLSLGFISAGERLFFEFADTAYELPVEQGQDSAENPCRRSGFGVDPRPWVEDAESHDDETIGGVETRHASGTLDSDRMLRDLNAFIARCGELLGPAASAFSPLSRQELDRAAQELRDPSFDVYVGKDDNVLRRLSASIVIEPTADAEAGEEERGPIALKFSIEFADLNGDQTIEAPANVRPLSQLQSQLGVDTLQDGLGLQGSEPGEAPGDGQTPREAPLDEYQSYADCLDRINPADTAALERCSALLNEP